MSISLTQLVGGSFQDSLGNLLSGGYLTLFLNNDEVVGDAQICAGVEITVPLDAFGNVVSSPGVFVYATDVMTPINAYYRVTGYTAEGQTAWGVNNQQISSGGIGGGTFDVSQWIPNQVISWFPSPQPVTLEVNGTLSSSQTVQNLEAGANVTLTDLGSGNISIAAAGGGSSIPVGSNVVSIPWSSEPNSNVALTDTAGTAVVVIPASKILCFPSHSTISMFINAAPSAPGGAPFPIDQIAISRTLPGSKIIVDTTNISFGGNFSPTLPAGINTSDSIALQIDAEHDYYVMVHGVYPGVYALYSMVFSGGLCDLYSGGMSEGVTNLIGVSPIQTPTVANGELSGNWLYAWQAS